MGGRKRCLSYRKYTERKVARTSAPLPVSLPLSSYTDAPLNSIEVLHARLSTLPLPPSWVINNAAKAPITLCKLRISSGNLLPRADVVVTITINPDNPWTVAFIHDSVNPSNCSLLSTVHSTLSSITSVQRVLSLIDSSRICQGNPDSSFLESWQQRSLTLHNSTGKLYCFVVLMHLMFQKL